MPRSAALPVSPTSRSRPARPIASVRPWRGPQTGLRARVARLASGLLLASACGLASAFGFDDVARLAAERAARPFVPPPAPPNSDWLARLSYDDYRSIRFRPAEAHGRRDALPFETQFFHVGRGHQRVLRLFEVRDGRPVPLTVPRAAFDYGALALPPKPGPHAEVAGFRLHHPINRPDVMDEVIAFLGASYFRAVSAGVQYGLSARGVVVDAVGGRGEEFPAFDTFWFERPAPGAREIVFHALLDGPRVAGAYRFTVRPGAETQVDVRARLHLRAPVALLGVAPLTSMFLFGENQPRADDFRPEVHDSDGLQLHGGDGEWVWRPLVNPPGVFVSSFAMTAPRGFGLMQRDRAFHRYEDLEAHYERRPSAWVEPLPDEEGRPFAAWAAGRVELLQFAAPDETHDNIGAWWVPERLPAPGEALDIGWRIRWQGDAMTLPPGARVVQTRRGFGYREGALPPDREQFHIDFDGEALRRLAPGTRVEAVVSASDPLLRLKANAYPNTTAGGWRLTLDVEGLDAARPLELRAFLRSPDATLTETWAYALPAGAVGRGR